ncbi:MAG: PAS domain S-box protein [Desulfomonile tiedjei]|nr:PAS domain S-box protein [Desulfomonile tiedjei]
MLLSVTVLILLSPSASYHGSPGLHGEDFDQEAFHLTIVESLVPRNLLAAGLSSVGWTFASGHKTRNTEYPKLLVSETTYRAIFEGSPVAIVHFDAAGTATAVNEHLLRLLCLREDQVVGKRLADTIQVPHVAQAIQAVLSGKKDRREWPCAAPHQTDVRTLAVDFAPLFECDGSVSGGIGVLHDVTERSKAEKKLQESVNEKEILLKRIHHRVKNNLQVITSLLDLQSAYVEDESFLEILKEMQDRIWSIAIVHEMLYRSESLARIDVHDYVEELVEGLFHSYGPKAAPIEKRLSIERVSFAIETAVPFGLMIHELVSSLLNEAFPEGTAGAVDMSLRSLGDDCFELLVMSRSSGKQPAMTRAGGRSFGLRLVEALTKQLRGEMEMDGESGMYARIRFRDITAGKRQEGL